MLKSIGRWIAANWERVLFAIVGFVLLAGSLKLIYSEKVTEAAVVFGLGFLSFIYANVARFKRFKGLGFEAELWEDKQKEAADLIERLREVVSIYTREVILGKVRAGRWGTNVDWASHWKLYDDLVTQHNVLGQRIDFSGVKNVMDDYFLFDMAIPPASKVQGIVMEGKRIAEEKVAAEFGSPVEDVEGFNKRLAAVWDIPLPLVDPARFSIENDLAGETLKVWEEAKTRLKRDFDVDVNADAEALERLASISKLYNSRPVQVTPELIAWANRKD